MSETISSLADAYERLDWPHDVVSAMRMLKAHADRVQAVVDAASASGSKIGDLAAAMERVSHPERLVDGGASIGPAGV